MSEQRLLRVIVALVAVFASSIVSADEAVHLQGCPIRLESNCVMLLDSSGTPYDITAMSRSRPAAKARGSDLKPVSIDLRGTVAEGLAGSCRRGVVVTDIRWHYTGKPCASR